MKHLLVCFAVLIAIAQAADYTVLVGANEENRPDLDAPAWMLISFHPASLVVEVGDTVTFVPNSEEGHTVTFSPEFVFDLKTWQASPAFGPYGGDVVYSGEEMFSSGFLGAPYTFTFNTTGFFPYWCIFHPMMAGFIEVIPQGAPIPDPAEVTMEAEMEIKYILDKLPTVEQVKRIAVPFEAEEDGDNMIYTVRVVGSVEWQATFMRWVPGDLEIEVGDSIVFVNDDIMGHIVTINDTMPDPNIIGPFGTLLPEYQPQNSEDAIEYFGGFATSSLLEPTFRPVGRAVWTVTFNTAGEFYYLCNYHSEMVGKITVMEPVEEPPVPEEQTNIQTQINFNFGGMIPASN